jgi:hypothetical protein
MNINEAYNSIYEAKVDDGKSEQEKRRIRTARQGYAGANLHLSSRSPGLHTGDVDRRSAHRDNDDLNKDARDIRKGKTNLPHFQGKTGKERVAHVKKMKGLPEELELWVNDLLDEGYDLSEYTWEDMAELYAEGFKSTGYHDDYDPYDSRRRNQSRTTSSTGKRIQKRVKDLEALGDQAKADHIHDIASDKYRTNHDYGLARQKRNKKRGPGPRRAKEDAMRDMKKSGFAEDLDIYDLVLEHLLEEGFADCEEKAQVIMCHMSEEWYEEILEAHKDLPVQKMKNRRYYVNMKTGEAAGSSRNEKIRSVLDAHQKDPEGEAANARAKSKYKAK